MRGNYGGRRETMQHCGGPIDTTGHAASISVRSTRRLESTRRNTGNRTTTGDPIDVALAFVTAGRRARVKGTVKDRKVNFSLRVEVQGTSIVVSYSGTVEGTDALKGTVDLGGQATGTFTAKRQ